MDIASPMTPAELAAFRYIAAGRRAYNVAQTPKIKLHVLAADLSDLINAMVVLDDSIPVDEIHMRNAYGFVIKKWKGVR